MANKMKYQNSLVLEIHDTLLKGQSSMFLRSLEFTKTLPPKQDLVLQQLRTKTKRS